MAPGITSVQWRENFPRYRCELSGRAGGQPLEAVVGCILVCVAQRGYVKRGMDEVVDRPSEVKDSLTLMH